MTQIVFETFSFPAFSVSPDAVLALHALGKTTGMAVSSGEGATHAVPVWEGNQLPFAISRLDIAGRDMTEHLAKLLSEGGHAFAGTSEREAAQAIKEKLCYVALNYESELQVAASGDSLNKSYELPDGRVISVGSECFRVPEGLFRPSQLGLGCASLPEATLSSIENCDESIRGLMFGYIAMVRSMHTYRIPNRGE